MPSQILVLAESDDLRDQIESALSGSDYQPVAAGSAAEAVAVMRDRPIDLVVAEGLAVSGSGQIESLRHASVYGVTPVLVVAPPARDVEARIAFLEAGADDVIAAGFAPNELDGRIMALLIRAGRLRPETERGGSHGELVVFFSPKGGVGTTTLAINVAVLLAGGGQAASGGNGTAPDMSGSRVLLVDLDLGFGQVATHLNIAPRFDVAGLASDEQALADPELSRSYLTAHSSGVSVLAAPVTPDADERVSVEALQRIVDNLRGHFDYLIFDLGSRLDPRSLWVLDQATTHVFTVFPEIAALRSVSVMLGYLQDTTPLRAQVHFVVNHIFPKELLKTRDVENLLRTKPAAEIPYTDVEMLRAVNEGVPLVVSRPTSPAAAALRQLARAVMGAQTPAVAVNQERRRGIFGRR
jgi:pilus assembly protein CpaE